MEVKAIIERGSDGTYDICLETKHTLPFGLLGQGKTVVEAKDDFQTCIEEMKEIYNEDAKPFPKFTVVYLYDAASFLQSYSKKISLAGLELITGINQRQLSQYLNGYRSPSQRTVKKIEESIHSFGKELSQVSFA